MAPPIPSREALRALSRLCRNRKPPSTRHYTPSTRKTSTSSPAYFINSRKLRPLPPCTVPCTRLTIRYKSTGPSSFANDPPSRIPESGSKETLDPQLDSTTTLPDITNYYTLFPKTIPHGPPQPPSRINSHTTVSGEQPSSPFHINVRDLRNEFLQLQSLYHPDKYAAGSTAHQRAYALSTLLNNAYKTLADPLLRAQYTLQLLYDIDVTNEDNSAHATDPQTLMFVMEAQEELEGAEGAEGEQTVERLREENKGRIRDTERQLGEAFEAGDVEKARDQSVKLKYWKSLEGALNEWEPGRDVRLVH